MDKKHFKLAQILIWVSGFLSFLTFALVGGYSWFVLKDEDLKNTTKKVFIITLVFVALSALGIVYTSFCQMINVNTGSFYRVVYALVQIARVVCFLAFMLMDILKSKKPENIEVVVEDENKSEL